MFISNDCLQIGFLCSNHISDEPWLMTEGCYFVLKIINFKLGGKKKKISLIHIITSFKLTETCGDSISINFRKFIIFLSEIKRNKSIVHNNSRCFIPNFLAVSKKKMEQLQDQQKPGNTVKSNSWSQFFISKN